MNIATAGQPTAEQFKCIALSGYQHVINLGMPDHERALANEDVLVATLGMNYVHIPVKFDFPQKAQVKFFCDVLSVLEQQRVFVHCIANYRVSAFMYHYLSIVKGYSKHDAKSAMFSSWDMSDAWQDVMAWSAQDIGLVEI